MGNASGKDRRGKNLIECLKEARRAVQARAIQGVAENQESQSSGSDAGIRWEVLNVQRLTAYPKRAIGSLDLVGPLAL
jgi:hypothetical protein